MVLSVVGIGHVDFNMHVPTACQGDRQNKWKEKEKEVSHGPLAIAVCCCNNLENFPEEFHMYTWPSRLIYGIFSR